MQQGHVPNFMSGLQISDKRIVKAIKRSIGAFCLNEKIEIYTLRHIDAF